jgi:hypothetical protein
LISCGNSSIKGGIRAMKRLAKNWKLLFTVCLIFGLVGCADRGNMTREETIAAVKQCEDAGMRAQIVSNGWTMDTVKVNCRLKRTAN